MFFSTTSKQVRTVAWKVSSVLILMGNQILLYGYTPREQLVMYVVTYRSHRSGRELGKRYWHTHFIHNVPDPRSVRHVTDKFPPCLLGKTKGQGIRLNPKKTHGQERN